MTRVEALLHLEAASAIVGARKVVEPASLLLPPLPHLSPTHPHRPKTSPRPPPFPLLSLLVLHIAFVLPLFL